jgi:GH25 family lysozyme M1 (1,4-beta-N-acetylmuramidase)
MLTLVDLSNNNPDPIGWRAMAASGVAGVWLKVSEGIHFTDRTFASRARAARAAGLRVGGYHFMRPEYDGAAQARYFAERLGAIGRHDLRPALDCEVADGMSPTAIVAASRAFNREVVQLTHVGPVFYTYTGFAESLGPSVPIGYGLWLANYGPNDGGVHPVEPPHPWRHVAAHQYTSRGHVPGIGYPVDLTTAPNLRPLLAHPAPNTPRAGANSGPET